MKNTFGSQFFFFFVLKNTKRRKTSNLENKNNFQKTQKLISIFSKTVLKNNF